jgi:hypothetical protein
MPSTHLGEALKEVEPLPLYPPANNLGAGLGSTPDRPRCSECLYRLSRSAISSSSNINIVGVEILADFLKNVVI